MTQVSAYTRPRSLDEANEALRRPGAVLIGGGTKLSRRGAEARVEVVDLQALGFDDIERGAGATLRMGATVTLQEVVDHAGAPDVVREAARREQPSTLRNQATVGGCVATGDPESELLAALLAYGAVVTFADGAPVPLEDVLASLPLGPDAIVTAVTIETEGRAAAERAARTTADSPIVAAVARSAGGALRLAMSGVADRPVLVTRIDELRPPGDFRGSGEYRAAVAAVLAARVEEAVR
ncbi:MAG TPA: FAD binding domain-containing protein [Acidimicrobiales bacterium]|nr:FAD binding domain-containing protein [Acidimicrobiales bacterium]